MYRRTYMRATVGVLAGGLLAGCTSEGEPANTNQSPPTTDANPTPTSERTRPKTTSRPKTTVTTSPPAKQLVNIDSSMQSDEKSDVVDVTITNMTDETLLKVAVTATFYDESGSKITTDSDFVSDLEQDETRNITLMNGRETRATDYELSVKVQDFD